MSLTFSLFVFPWRKKIYTSKAGRDCRDTQPSVPRWSGEAENTEWSKSRPWRRLLRWFEETIELLVYVVATEPKASANSSLEEEAFMRTTARKTHQSGVEDEPVACFLTLQNKFASAQMAARFVQLFSDLSHLEATKLHLLNWQDWFGLRSLYLLNLMSSRHAIELIYMLAPIAC